MRRFPLVLALALALLCSATPPRAAARQPAADPKPLTKAQWREDLQHFARELAKRHANAFHHTTREQFERAVAELDAAIPSLEDHQIVVRLLQLTSKVGDAHTYVHLPQTFKRYPVVLFWFGRDLRVVRAAGEYKDALGTRVVKIGGVEIGEVQARLLSVLSQDENEWFVLGNSPAYMVIPEVLHTLGVVPDVGRAAFTFEDDKGKQFTMGVAPVVPDANLGSLLLSAAKSEPLYRQRPTEQFWFTHLPDSQTVYVNFRGYPKCGILGSCQEFDDLMKLVDERQPARLVVDMRQNGGGDFTKVRRGLIPAIKKRTEIDQPGRLFVVTGRRTLSAAMTNAIDFKKETNATIVGEPPGERPNSYQENDEMTLPNSRLVVSYSTKYYKFLDADAPAFMPDKRVDPNWGDYKAGRDPVLDWILSQPAGKD